MLRTVISHSGHPVRHARQAHGDIPQANLKLVLVSIRRLCVVPYRRVELGLPVTGYSPIIPL